MKRTLLTIATICIVTFTYGQNEYYWSAGKKHYLKKEVGSFIVKLDNELS